jgi:hypothetical protein
MRKKKREQRVPKSSGKQHMQLPKDALSRVNLGQAFAEYDIIRTEPYLFVRTPPLLAALEEKRSKAFFVGRRGTGNSLVPSQRASTQNSFLRFRICSPIWISQTLTNSRFAR